MTKYYNHARQEAGRGQLVARQAINDKRKFDLEKSIDFANLPWLKGLSSVS